MTEKRRRRRDKDCGGKEMISFLIKRRRKNLVERLNRAITIFPEITLDELSKISRNVKPFLEDEEIKKLYDILKKKLTEHDDHVWDMIQEGLDRKTISELENVKREWRQKHGYAFLLLSSMALFGKTFEITTKKYLRYVEEELKSWRKVLPDSVIKEIENSMTLAEVLAAVAHFREMYKKVVYGKEFALYVEGDSDIKYILRAAELYGKNDLLNHFEIESADGYPNLDKFYNGHALQLAKVIPCKTILLYDCDTGKQDANKGKIFKRGIPTVPDNPIHKGIENLFRKALIEKAKEYKAAFIDITFATSKTERGQQISVPEVWKINEDEKGNLCNWIIQNGTKEDFERFNLIFDLLIEIKNAL